MAKVKHIPPSRVRYEKANPVVSVRISRELRDSLEEIQRLSGKSFADILRDGANRSKPLVKKSYERGYKKGQLDAKEDQLCWYCEKANGEIATICPNCLHKLDPKCF